MIRLDNGVEMKAAVVNRERKAAGPVAIGDRVWLNFTAEAGVVLTR